MQTFSLFLRGSLWLASAALLVKSLVSGEGVLDLALFILVALVAVLYGWLDNEYFGELILYGADMPPSSVRAVDPYTGLAPSADAVCYHGDTPGVLRCLLDQVRQDRRYVRIHYGDVETGQDQRSAVGFVNLSLGAVQIPLLSSTGDRGGVPIVDHMIVQVVDVSRDAVLYRHPTYQPATTLQLPADSRPSDGTPFPALAALREAGSRVAKQDALLGGLEDAAPDSHPSLPTRHARA